MDRREVLTAVASAVVAASLPLTLEIDGLRRRQSMEDRKTSLQQETVDVRRTTGDFDGDGVDDEGDSCPRRPETVNGFRDLEGCPDVVASTGAS